MTQNLSLLIAIILAYNESAEKSGAKLREEKFEREFGEASRKVNDRTVGW